MCRLQFSLAYNYLTLLNLTPTTSYEEYVVVVALLHVRA